MHWATSGFFDAYRACVSPALRDAVFIGFGAAAG